MNEDALPPTIDKPAELLALHDVSADLFATLRRWFGVGPSITLDLDDIDSAVVELGDPLMIAGVAMRKLQALRLVSTPGVLTSTDVVVAMINDLNRALLAAPSLYLNLRAEHTDWDQALADLDAGSVVGDAPIEADEADPDIEAFRELHARLHDTVLAVLEASDGEVRYFR